MLQNILDGVKGVFFEIRDGLREKHSEIVEDYVSKERIKGIENTSLALCEARVKDDMIISLLVKYWDLRPSEAKYYLQETKKLIKH